MKKNEKPLVGLFETGITSKNNEKGEKEDDKNAEGNNNNLKGNSSANSASELSGDSENSFNFNSKGDAPSARVAFLIFDNLNENIEQSNRERKTLEIKLIICGSTDLVEKFVTSIGDPDLPKKFPIKNKKQERIILNLNIEKLCMEENENYDSAYFKDAFVVLYLGNNKKFYEDKLKSLEKVFLCNIEDESDKRFIPLKIKKKYNVYAFDGLKMKYIDGTPLIFKNINKYGRRELYNTEEDGEDLEDIAKSVRKEIPKIFKNFISQQYYNKQKPYEDQHTHKKQEEQKKQEKPEEEEEKEEQEEREEQEEQNNPRKTCSLS